MLLGVRGAVLVTVLIGLMASALLGGCSPCPPLPPCGGGSGGSLSDHGANGNPQIPGDTKWVVAEHYDGTVVLPLFYVLVSSNAETAELRIHTTGGNVSIFPGQELWFFAAGTHTITGGELRWRANNVDPTGTIAQKQQALATLINAALTGGSLPSPLSVNLVGPSGVVPWAAGNIPGNWKTFEVASAAGEMWYVGIKLNSAGVLQKAGFGSTREPAKFELPAMFDQQPGNAALTLSFGSAPLAASTFLSYSQP